MKKTIKLGRSLGGPISNLLGSIRSSTCSKKKVAVAAIALTALMSMLVAALVFPLKTLANNDDLRTFTVDVALGLPYFQNNVNPRANPGDFFQGDTFIQDGNIYPAGTIPRGKTNFDPNAAGAIGKYRARGTWTTDIANFERAAAHDKGAASDLAFASEMYSLLADKSILLTDGTWPNSYFSANRVVLGGTGSFRYIVGEVHEENIGENISGNCNFRVTFELRKVGN